MGNRPIHIDRVVLAAHSILTGYGHWGPNDIRGSGSDEVRKPEIDELGPIHFGRKRVQPPRPALRAYHQEFEQKLDHPVMWFDEGIRDVIARAVEQACTSNGYTLHALAVLRNHMHYVVRTHRDDAETINGVIAHATTFALLEAKLVPDDHPVWSQRPWKVFLRSRSDVLGRVRYVGDNPEKERLPRQTYPFVVPFK